MLLSKIGKDIMYAKPSPHLLSAVGVETQIQENH
jgi:hypothetical protein